MYVVGVHVHVCVRVGYVSLFVSRSQFQNGPSDGAFPVTVDQETWDKWKNW